MSKNGFSVGKAVVMLVVLVVGVQLFSALVVPILPALVVFVVLVLVVKGVLLARRHW